MNIAKHIIPLIWTAVIVISVIIFVQRAEINNKQAQLDSLKKEYAMISNQVEQAKIELSTIKSDEWQILSARKKGWGYPNEKRYVAK